MFQLKRVPPEGTKDDAIVIDDDSSSAANPALTSSSSSASSSSSSSSGLPFHPEAFHRWELPSIVSCVRHDQDGYLGASGSDRLASVCNLVTRVCETDLPHQPVQSKAWGGGPEHEMFVRDVCFTKSNSFLCTGCEDSTVRVWRISDSHLRHTFEGHMAPITSITLISSSSDLASASTDGSLRGWNMGTGKCIQSVFGPVDADGHPCVANSTDASLGRGLLASGWSDGAVRIYSLPDMVPVHTIKAAHKRDVYCVRFSLDGTLLLCASLDGTASIWTTDRWDAPLATISSRSAGMLFSAAWSDDATWALVGAQSGVILCKNVRTGELWELSGLTAPVVSLSLRNDTLIAATAEDVATVIKLRGL